MRNRWLGLWVTAALLVFVAAVYARLPAEVPVHWNAAGEVDDRAAKEWGVALHLGLVAGVWGLGWVLPRIDPRRERYAGFEGTYWFVINLVVLFLAGVGVLALGTALGWPLDVARTIQVGTGALLAAIGNVLPRVKTNWWVGIRTPWTLSSERVWRQTHRVGGRIFVAGGILMALGALLPEEGRVATMLATVAVVTVLPLAYSYLLWRQEGAVGDRR